MRFKGATGGDLGRGGIGAGRTTGGVGGGCNNDEGKKKGKKDGEAQLENVSSGYDRGGGKMKGAPPLSMAPGNKKGEVGKAAGNVGRDGKRL